jgi:hypothetical protein
MHKSMNMKVRKFKNDLVQIHAPAAVSHVHTFTRVLSVIILGMEK